MRIATGIALVLITWALALGVATLLGLLAAIATSSPTAARPVVIRRAMWWGVTIAAIALCLVNLAVPLHSAAAALAMAVLVLALGAPGLLLLRRRAMRAPGAGRRWGWAHWIVGIALAVALVYLAYTALGPVTNYDTGLYHLGAIRYAAEWPTIPGLASLYGPLGYATATFPLAAILGNGPWQDEGYRLLNGLLMSAATVDLVLRLRARRPGPGAFVLGIGILAAWVPLLALSDYWVTSPTQDAAALVLTLAVAALIVDAVRGARDWIADAAVALALCMLLVLVRPTMAAFAGATLVLVILLAIRRRPRGQGRAAAAVIVVAIAATIAIAARDVLLSGWLLYPLSLARADVAWAAPDPTTLRLATLGFHRDPSDFQAAILGWDWVLPWLRDRLQQWETYELALLALAAIGACITASRSGGLQWRRMTVAMAPSVIAVIVWWALTPPSYRFAWGPLFSLIAIPLGWALWRLARGSDAGPSPARRWWSITAVGIAVPVVAVAAFSTMTRTDPAEISQDRIWRIGLEIPYAVAPIPAAEVARVTTDSGLELLVPVRSDQCWQRYPLCTPEPRPSLRLRGEGIPEGFLP